MKTSLTVALAGLGNRGRQNYAKYAEAHPEQIKIVAVADIIPERVAEAAKTFGVAPENCFSTAEEMSQKEKLADIMFICTPDRYHYVPAINALRKGYHLLLEKPISPSPEECREIVKTANEMKRHVVVCHVLRYTPFFSKLKDIICSGVIGNIMTVQNIENVGYYHQAHSFVRGNWRDEQTSTPMILQKCCHDMDILLWLAQSTVKRVSSYGRLSFFKEENAPEGSTNYCLDGCKVKDQCPYDAEKIYITNELTGVRHKGDTWPSNVFVMNPTEESVREALREGQYGRCVYHCDNNVVDHQVVNLELHNNTTISHTMTAFTSEQYRYLKVMGTMGDIEANMATNIIKVCEFGKEPVEYDINQLGKDLSGHAGGDVRMVADLVELVSGKNSSGRSLTSIEDSMESHYACFAAEYSRLHNGESVQISR